MQCPSCESYKRQPLSGLYQMTCLGCCTRLVLSARPDKRQAAAMLAAIARCEGSPSRQQVLASVAGHTGQGG